MVYTAESQSLAVLEVLVHLDAPDLLKKYVLLEVEMDTSLIADVDISALPKNWKSDPPPNKVQSIGDDWAISGASTVLRVPSTLVPGECNFLLNPRHADFGKLRFGKPLSFQFDPRLGKKD